MQVADRARARPLLHRDQDGLADLGPKADPLEITSDLVLSTVDAWVVWNLTGGTDGGVLVTDATNASRTLLYDIHDTELVCRARRALRGTPVEPPGRRPFMRAGWVSSAASSAVEAASSVRGAGVGDRRRSARGAVRTGVLQPGMAKVTNGTGSFVLLTHGPEMPDTRAKESHHRRVGSGRTRRRERVLHLRARGFGVRDAAPQSSG